MDICIATTPWCVEIDMVRMQIRQQLVEGRPTGFTELVFWMQDERKLNLPWQLFKQHIIVYGFKQEYVCEKRQKNETCTHPLVK